MAGAVTLAEIREVLEADVLWADDCSLAVDSVGAADLMSDVLTMSKPGMLLLTGLATLQSVRTAAVADLRAVVFVRGKTPPTDVIALAREKRIPVLTTPLSMFEAAGLLYKLVSTGSERESGVKTE
jgi:predicted transcriptional regulator